MNTINDLKKLDSLQRRGIYIGCTNTVLKGLMHNWYGSFHTILASYAQKYPVIEWDAQLQTLVPESQLIEVSHCNFRRVTFRFRATERSFAPDGHLASDHWKQFILQLRELPLKTTTAIIFSLSKDTAYSRALLDSIILLRESLYTIKVLLEVDHHSWKHSEAVKILRGSRLLVVQRDVPELTGFQVQIPNYNRTACYLRLLGRNKVNWFSLESAIKYQYSYNSKELDELANKIVALRAEYDEVYIIASYYPAKTTFQNLHTLVDLIDGRR